MGVEHYLACIPCGEYIDLHKAYAFAGIIERERPPVGIDGECKLHGNYWEGRGLWFLWKHRSHNIELWQDSHDAWFELEPKLKEVFPHNDDLKLRPPSASSPT